MIRFLYVTLLLFTSFVYAEWVNNEDESLCPPGSRCTPQWKCNRHGEGVVMYRSLDNSTPCPYQQICCINEMIIVNKMLRDPEQRCGARNTSSSLLHINNSEGKSYSKFGELPWMVAIFENKNGTKKYIGGGSILTPNVILTAAHTVFERPTANLLVRAGEWDLSTELEPSPYQEHGVLLTICHENFNKLNLRNDIAVINLSSELTFSYHISPICLPRESELGNIERCFVAGWGKSSFKDSKTSSVLRSISLPIFNNSVCQQKLRLSRLGLHFKLHESFVCAGGEAELDACTGDGGSPLFCQLYGNSSQYYQLGIVAWGLGCNTKNVPGVYASIPNLLSWLHTVLYSLSVHPNHYTYRPLHI